MATLLENLNRLASSTVVKVHVNPVSGISTTKNWLPGKNSKRN